MSTLPPFPFPQGGTQPQQPRPTLPPGYSPPHTSIPGEMVQGLNQFVQSYIGAKNAAKDMYRQQFEQALSDRINGIPVPDEHLAGLAKKSGMKLPIYSENEMQEYKAATTKAAQEQQIQQALLTQGGNQATQTPTTGMGPGGVDPATAQMMTAQVPSGVNPPQPQMPPQPQGLLQRIRQQMAPPTAAQAGPGSPFANFLQRLDQGVQAGGGLPGQLARAGGMAQQQYALQSAANKFQMNTGMQLQNMTADQQKTLLNLTHAALSGDDNARMRLVKNGLIKGMPIDEMTMMGLNMGYDYDTSANLAGQLGMMNTMGVPQFKLAMLQQAEKLMPYFSGSVDPRRDALTYAMGGKPSSAPHMPLDDWAKLQEGIDKIRTKYPHAPENLARTYALSTLFGQDGTMDGVTSALGEHMGESQGAGDLRARLQDSGANAARVGIEQGRLNNDIWNTHQRLAVDQVQALKSATMEELAPFWKIWEDPNQPVQQRREAAAAIGSGLQKLNQVPVNIDGQKFTLGMPAMQGWSDWFHRGGSWGSVPMIQLEQGGYDLGSGDYDKNIGKSLVRSDDLAKRIALKKDGIDLDDWFASHQYGGGGIPPR